MEIFNSFKKSIIEISKLSVPIVDVTEAFLDTTLKEGVLKEIPIISDLINIVGAVDSIKSYFLLRKISKFLIGTSIISEQDRENFEKKYLQTTIDTDRFYKNLLIYIDRLDNEEKSLITSNLFCSLIYQRISIQEFLRILNIIEKVYIEDLKYFIFSQGLSGDDSCFKDHPDRNQLFLSHGLIEIREISYRRNGKEIPEFLISSFGNTVKINCNKVSF